MRLAWPLPLLPAMPLARAWRMLRPGDVVVLLLGLAAIVMLANAGQGGAADQVVIRQDGRVLLETNLRLDQMVEVPGPLGITRVEIHAGQVRVLSDPGERQLCVRQGWIAPGGAAICLPNRVSVERGVSRYDSLHY